MRNFSAVSSVPAHRSLNPAESSTNQLMIAGGGGLLGAVAGFKLGKKRGAASKWAALGALGGAALGFFGAHAAGA